MSTREIHPTEWNHFCQKFTEIHKGYPVTIEVMDSRMRPQEIARDTPLEEITFEKTDECNDRIHIRVHGEREIEHTITGPIHVKILQEGEGKKHLRIVAESGATMVGFHSGKIEELLDGVRLANVL